MRLGAAGSGASGSSTISARLLAPLGTPDQASGGDVLAPSQVCRTGIAPPCAKEAERSSILATSARLKHLASTPVSRLPSPVSILLPMRLILAVALGSAAGGV